MKHIYLSALMAVGFREEYALYIIDVAEQGEAWAIKTIDRAIHRAGELDEDLVI